jgi:hypothetical protein
MSRGHRWQMMTFALFFLLTCSAGFAGPDRDPAAPHSPWFQVETVVDDGSVSIDRLLINGPPEPPPGSRRSPVDLPASRPGAV